MTSTHATRRVWRVIITDDHPMLVEGIKETLRDAPEFEVVGACASEAEAARCAEELSPEIAIVDLSLEKGSGLSLVKVLKEHNPEIRVLVFTMHDEELYAERVMRAGALGYLHKGATADELLTALRDVARGEIAMSDAMNQRLVHKALGQGEQGRGVGDLSDREIEIFEHIGRGQSVHAIAHDLGISPKTVETHREHIKKKLDIASAAELARYAVAWVENPDP